MRRKKLQTRNSPCLWFAVRMEEKLVENRAVLLAQSNGEKGDSKISDKIKCHI